MCIGAWHGLLGDGYVYQVIIPLQILVCFGGTRMARQEVAEELFFSRLAPWVLQRGAELLAFRLLYPWREQR